MYSKLDATPDPTDSDVQIDDTHAFNPNPPYHHPQPSQSPSNTKIPILPVSPALSVPYIDDHNRRYPYSIVWGTLPLISWLLPCIGHLGVCDSRGHTHDFHSAYNIRIGRFMTGPVYRYYQFDEEALALHISTPQDWDKAVLQSDKHYGGTVHNIVTNNCHHHVATAMSNMGYPMSMFEAWVLITFKGKWVSRRKCAQALLPSMILWGIIIGFILIFGLLFK